MHNPLSHAVLLADRVRNRAFARAIRRVVRPGDVVLDLGAGTGLLACLAARSGARRVYAVEHDAVAAVARLVVARNGLEDRVRILRGDSRRVRLPSRADVLVTETLGEGIFNEWILALVGDARRRHLRRGARVVPRAIWMEALPVSAAPALRAQLDIARVEGIDMAPAAAVARHAPTFTSDPPTARLAGPRPLLRYALDGRGPFRCPREGCAAFAVLRPGRLDGILAALAADLAPGVRLSAWRRTHWSRLFFPLHAPLRVRRGDRVLFRCTLRKGWTYDWDVAVRRGGRVLARSEHRHHFADAAVLETIERLRRLAGRGNPKIRSPAP